MSTESIRWHYVSCSSYLREGSKDSVAAGHLIICGDTNLLNLFVCACLEGGIFKL